MGTKRLNIICQNRYEEYGEDWGILLVEKKEQISASKSVTLDIFVFFFLIPERRLWKGE